MTSDCIFHLRESGPMISWAKPDLKDYFSDSSAFYSSNWVFLLRAGIYQSKSFVEEGCSEVPHADLPQLPHFAAS